MKLQHRNIVQFEVMGDYALFSDPIMRMGGEKCSYQAPTYEALKGILSSVYWKPTFIWYIDKVRIMNPIQTMVKGIRPIKYNGGNDLSFYTYLKNCRYQVEAHFEWNQNRPELEKDRNENKHQCQGYVEPCVFGEGKGHYDDVDELSFGLVLHGITYADEAYSEETKGKMTVRFWRPVMKRGIIDFVRPEKCDPRLCKTLCNMEMKAFGEDLQNFTGLKEFGEVN